MARSLLASQGGIEIRARTTFHRRLRAIVLAELVAMSVLLVPAALAETAATDLSVSASLVSYGRSVTVTGSISAGPGCSAGRTVDLQWRPADSSAFATVATGTSAGDGSFRFDPSQTHTGRYRASLPEEDGCLASTSNEALVRVRALVDATLLAATTEAGGCLKVVASVDPPKPNQILEMQRRGAGGWQVTHRLTLDGTSEARVSPCLSLDDVGMLRLRMRWIAQDALNVSSSSPLLAVEVTRAPWMNAIDDAIGNRSVSVAVGEEDEFLYRHAARRTRIPASNEKLLLSMAMYDAFGPAFRIRTSAASAGVTANGTVENLWILGRGDPRVDNRTLGSLAREVDRAGVTRVRGRVLGSTSYFRRDWDAPGWNDVARDYVNRPTALSFERNARADPERRAAKALTQKLEARGIRVAGEPGAGNAPPGLEAIAFVESQPLQLLLTKTLRPSDNYMAETLGKRLGAETRGVPGTIAKGAGSIQAWSAGHGVEFTLNDNSGLSYANRVTAEGIVRLLWVAEDEPWGSDLRKALPTGGQGTLVHRLHRAEVRAKTGTLEEVSALSGWVRSRSTDSWVEFSILSFGMSKSSASEIEDQIVLILQNQLG